MTKTPRLNDLQLILLSAAAARDNGCLLPLPENVASDMPRVNTALAALIKRRLIEEQAVTDRKLAFRDDGEEPVGVFITGVGREAIGASDDAGTGNAGSTPTKSPPAPADKTPRMPTKAETVLGLLKRAEGATLAELVAATSWLPHTTRAHLTGLRKKGHTIDKSKRDDATCYRIVEAG